MPAEYDFIVVGAGAGGGPLACNLALAPEGYRVALIEAGGDPAFMADSYHYYNYSIPGLHARASEDDEMSWKFFVQHYGAQARQSKDYDSKYVDEEKTLHGQKPGVFYPRASALGGCTAHHALITVYPHNADWENLRRLTGDDGWSAEAMRKLIERLERCRYVPHNDGQTTDPITRHGLAGWLPTSMADPTLAFGDDQLLKLLFKAFLFAQIDLHQQDALALLLDKSARANPTKKGPLKAVLEKAAGRLVKDAVHVGERVIDSLGIDPANLEARFTQLAARAESADDVFKAFTEDPSLLGIFRMLYTQLDPNRWFEGKDSLPPGVYSTPASIDNGTRSAVRERILQVKRLYPDRLDIICHALATKVIIENGRATGVRYLAGAHLYRASMYSDLKSPLPDNKDFNEVRLRERGEVILSGGTFNTPQLLILSGVGPKDELERLQINDVKCVLQGVGRNLQDRYEMGFVCELKDEFKVLDGSKFQAPAEDDPEDLALQEWRQQRGVYASNGVVFTIIKTSSQAAQGIPDLFLFGLPGYFKGYFPGYSNYTQAENANGTWQPNHHRFTWAILKGRTRNKNGDVKLVSTDPRDPPQINFRYFDEGTPDGGKDLAAMVEGIRFAARLMESSGLNYKVLVPPPDVNINNDNQLADFVRKEAWGHHACGTCKIGKDNDPEAVLDGDFRLRGIKNLRVVDASAVPDIPGFFIVSSIYLMSEKASDVVLRDQRQPPRPWPEAPKQ
jgi:choline dehydrogenase